MTSSYFVKGKKTNTGNALKTGQKMIRLGQTKMASLVILSIKYLRG